MSIRAPMYLCSRPQEKKKKDKNTDTRFAHRYTPETSTHSDVVRY